MARIPERQTDIQARQKADAVRQEVKFIDDEIRAIGSRMFSAVASINKVALEVAAADEQSILDMVNDFDTELTKAKAQTR